MTRQDWQWADPLQVSMHQDGEGQWVFTSLSHDGFQSSTLISQAGLRDIDILGDIRGAFDDFVSSGQVWAMMIGVVIGYLFRSITAY